MSVLGIDVGTSTCKGVVLNAEGKIIAQTQKTYSEKPTIKNQFAEIPAETFKDGVFSVIKKLASVTRAIDPIQAIALSTHGETLILVDEKGNALRPALLSMDRRGVLETEILADTVGMENFYRICGTPIHSQYPVPKIMWLQTHERATVKKTSRYCTAQDYLHGVLGVEGYVDHSLASRFGGFDIKKREWSKDVLDAAEINKVKFSTPVVSGTSIGTLPRSIADELGLQENVRLVLGGHDQPCAALGMGATENTMTVSAGSYECVSVMTERPLNGEDGYRFGLNSYCHVLENKYVTLAFFASGLVVSWFMDKFCALFQKGEEDIFVTMERLAPKTPTGICFTPHIYGSLNPCWDDRAKAKILGLTAETGVKELYRAVLEGAASELDLNVSLLERLAGKTKELTFCGGGTRSGLWMQIRADILGRRICRLDNDVDASCMGAAILAGIGNNTFKNVQQAIEAIKYSKTEFDPRNSEGYTAQKKEYRALYQGIL